MARTFEKYSTVPTDVFAAWYTGEAKNATVILNRIRREGGVAFRASELMWRHDMGTYFHKDYGFVYLPQGARNPGGTLQPLRDDELVVLSNENTFALVFPGDYVVRGRSGFYPLASESFSRSHVSYNSHRRGVSHRVPPAS